MQDDISQTVRVIAAADASVSDLRLPLMLSNVAAGFPSPAEDYADCFLNLHEYLVEHPAATFFVRVAGESMLGAGIHDGDLLVVDRALEPRNGHVVIAVVDGDMTVKRLIIRNERMSLEPANPAFPVLDLDGELDVLLWGVCRYVVHCLT